MCGDRVYGDSPEFCCEHKTALKNKVNVKIYIAPLLSLVFNNVKV